MTKKRILLIVETSRGYGRGIMEGISRFALEQGNWQIHFDDRGLLEEPSDWLRRWNGDGIISRTAVPSLARILSRKKCPVVELHGFGDYGKSNTAFSEVQICNESIGEMAAEHFFERGFRDLAFYSCRSPWWFKTRSISFAQSVKRRGGICHIYSNDPEKLKSQHPIWENRDEILLKKWLLQLPKPIGIWAITDNQAFRVLEGCQDIGLRVPEEVAILGTANDPLICNLLSPPLSSIDVNSIRIGYEAARRLALKMEGQTPTEPFINVPPLEVITRQSTDIIAIPEQDIVDAIRLIREKACDGITVEKVVQEVGISRRTLERYFFKHLGLSPHDEIVRVRINHAKTLLRTTTLSISAIAQKSGFTNREYFISTFHRHAGTTPHSYRTGRS